MTQQVNMGPGTLRLERTCWPCCWVTLCGLPLLPSLQFLCLNNENNWAASRVILKMK